MQGIQITVPARNLVIHNRLDKKIEAALAEGRKLPISFDDEVEWLCDNQAYRKVEEKIERGDLTQALLGDKKGDPWDHHVVFAYALTHWKDRARTTCNLGYGQDAWYHGNHKRWVSSAGNDYLVLDSANLSSSTPLPVPWVNLDIPNSRRLRRTQADHSFWPQFLSVLLKFAKQTGQEGIPEIASFKDFLAPEDFGDWVGHHFRADEYLESLLPIAEQGVYLNDPENIIPGTHEGSYPAYIHRGDLCLGLATRDRRFVNRRGSPLAFLWGGVPMYKHQAFKPEELPLLLRATYRHYASIRAQIPKIIEASGLVKTLSVPVNT